MLHEHSRTLPTGQPAAASGGKGERLGGLWRCSVEGAVSWSAPGGAIGSIGDWEDWEGGAIVSRGMGKTLWISLGMRMTKYHCLAMPQLRRDRLWPSKLPTIRSGRMSRTGTTSSGRRSVSCSL